VLALAIEAASARKKSYFLLTLADNERETLLTLIAKALANGAARRRPVVMARRWCQRA